MISKILSSEVLQWYLIGMLIGSIFILLVGSFYTNTSSAMLGMTT